ncbi:hypothetical protein GAYE_SCF66G6825 [Galdieria yellowstonensis]|uniref:Spindle assembly checkpoint component MAD1 n=1 Tax=Galdieria yellowstonensis TaxID=3028027 RepID=A0AAV9IN59_9RHOD|nr:hypothetical protein GAYE_SCF66G6825 [Galdieria yellowstonensis]
MSEEEEPCDNENILASLYQQLKTLQFPAVLEALETTPRGKHVAQATIPESSSSVTTQENMTPKLQAIAIALKNQLVRTTEQMEYWKQMYETCEEQRREWKAQWEEKLTLLTTQWQEAKAKYEESEWKREEREREWEQWKEKAMQDVEYWKQSHSKSNAELIQLRSTLEQVQMSRRRAEDAWQRHTESLQQQIDKLEQDKTQLVSQLETLGDRWKVTMEELEEERRWNKELLLQLEQANERCKQLLSVVLQELREARKEIEALKCKWAEAEEAKNSLEILREQSNELLELVHDLTGLENVEEAIQRWKNGMLSREEGNAQDKRTSELQQQMEATIATLRDELQQSQLRCTQWEKQYERVQQRMRLLENERDGLKRILNEWDTNMMMNDRSEENLSYYTERLKLLEAQHSEMETTLKQWEKEAMEKDRLVSCLKKQLEEWNNMPQHSSLSMVASLRSKLLSTRLELSQLQQQRKELEEQVQVLNQTNQQLASTVKEYKTRIYELEQTADAQKQQIESLEACKIQMQEEIESLEKHIGSGYFNPRYTKVLHLKGGPPLSKNYFYHVNRNTNSEGEHKKRARWIQEQPQVVFDPSSPMEEQAATSPQDESPAPSTSNPSSASWNVLSLPAEKWKEKALDAEKRAQRTRQVAKAKINEFRETCYHLFGWKIHVVGAQYRLVSMYAQTSNEILCFGRDERGGGLQLLETEYCHTIRNEIEKYCTKLNSIPALLATITLDNFQSPCGPTPGTSGLT